MSPTTRVVSEHNVKDSIRQSIAESIGRAMSPAKHVSTIENFRDRLNAPTFAKGRRLQVNVHLTENWEFVHDGGAELVLKLC